MSCGECSSSLQSLRLDRPGGGDGDGRSRLRRQRRRLGMRRVVVTPVEPALEGSRVRGRSADARLHCDALEPIVRRHLLHGGARSMLIMCACLHTRRSHFQLYTRVPALTRPPKGYSAFHLSKATVTLPRKPTTRSGQSERERRERGRWYSGGRTGRGNRDAVQLLSRLRSNGN